MAEYLKLEDAKEILKNIRRDLQDKQLNTMKDVEQFIELDNLLTTIEDNISNILTIQIITCKDCYFGRQFKKRVMCSCHNYDVMNPNDFCSKGCQEETIENSYYLDLLKTLEKLQTNYFDEQLEQLKSLSIEENNKSIKETKNQKHLPPTNDKIKPLLLDKRSKIYKCRNNC